MAARTKLKAPTAVPIQSWTYDFLAAYDVLASKSLTVREAERNISGGVIKINQEIESYMGRLFERDEETYDIPICFVGDQSKNDSNPIRTHIRALAHGPQEARRRAARALAVKLALATPGTTKEGLLVVMVGQHSGTTRVVLWRFGAGASLSLVTKKEGEAELKVNLRTFTKGTQYFKAALFEGSSARTAFWEGQVRDTQSHAREVDHARYWVNDFLEAQSSITDARGTKLLETAIKATNKELKDPAHQANLTQAARLAATQKGMRTSLSRFADNLLPEVREAFLRHAGSERVREAIFTVDRTTALRRFGARRVLINGRISLQAPNDAFGREVVMGQPDGAGETTITIRGRITREEVRSNDA